VEPRVQYIYTKLNMSFGFGISDIEYIFSLTIDARRVLKDLRRFSNDDELDTDINLMVDWLKDSLDLLRAVERQPPSSVLAAMERCMRTSTTTFRNLDDFRKRLQSDRSSEEPDSGLEPKLLQYLKQENYESANQEDIIKTDVARMLETGSTFHNAVSQFYNRTQLDRLLELQRSTKRQHRDYADADEHDDQGASEPKLPLTGNAGYPTSIFRGGIAYSTASSEKPQWWGVQGKFDSGSSVNMVSLDLLRRCGLEKQAIEIEPITLVTREDQEFVLTQKIRLTWAMNNDIRSYITDFHVDPKAIVDILLGDCFAERRNAENSNKSFLNAKVKKSTAGKS